MILFYDGNIAKPSQWNSITIVVTSVVKRIVFERAIVKTLQRSKPYYSVICNSFGSDFGDHGSLFSNPALLFKALVKEFLTMEGGQLRSWSGFLYVVHQCIFSVTLSCPSPYFQHTYPIGFNWCLFCVFFHEFFVFVMFITSWSDFSCISQVHFFFILPLFISFFVSSLALDRGHCNHPLFSKLPRH